MPEFCVKHFFIFCFMPSFFFRFILYFANIASRFCTMSAAITGQAFMPSYRYTRLVFAQNGWEMITVDALASSTCSSCSFVVGFVIGCIAYVITSAGLHWNNVDHGHLWAITAALMSGAIAFAIFQLFASLMVNVVESL